MAVTLTTAAKTAVMTGLKDHFAGGALEILDASDVLLVSYTINVSGGSVAAGNWTVGFVSATTESVAAGTASKAQIKTAGGIVDLTGLTAGEAADTPDVELNDKTITSAQNITISTLTITHD